MREMWGRMREWLWGTSAPPAGLPQRTLATSLIHQIAHGGARSLSDEQLMALVGLLLDRPALRRPLYGNARFLTSVADQYARKRTISARQRQGILNVLEKAYPGSLAFALREL